MSKNKIGYLLMAISIPMFALAVLVFTVQQAGAAQPSVDLQQCANGGSNETDYCSYFGGGSQDVGWVTGNSNAQKSTYWIGDFIVYRMIFKDLTSNTTYCGGFSWDVAQQNEPAIDYIGTFSQTMFKADPVVGTAYAGQRLNPDDKLPIPTDPQLIAMTMDSSVFTGTQKAGRIELWGGQFVASPVSPTLPILRYGNVGQYSDWYLDPQPANQQSLEFCFTSAPTATQAVATWAGHIADPDNWDPSLTRPSGSPYHTRYGTSLGFTPPRTSTGQFWGSDGTNRNFGNLEVQLDISLFPTAITLLNMTAESQSGGVYLMLLAVGTLALITGGVLVWRQRQAVRSSHE